ncbi:MAG: 50S ribosomal protein L10 [Proteobacteria bacterium]|nr:50S ribosomal protein L10 [Pseudomonadota bacterium]
MDRATKEQFVGSLRDALNHAGLVVVTHQAGLTVAETRDLRDAMRLGESFYKVTKNTLARLAVKGTKFESLESMFSGPMALAFSADPIAAAKISIQYASTNEKFSIVGGSLNGELLDAEGIKQLALLPSLDELRGKIVGVLVAPATRVATLMQAPAAQLARVLNAYATKEAA